MQGAISLLSPPYYLPHTGIKPCSCTTSQVPQGCSEQRSCNIHTDKCCFAAFILILLGNFLPPPMAAFLLFLGSLQPGVNVHVPNHHYHPLHGHWLLCLWLFSHLLFFYSSLLFNMLALKPSYSYPPIARIEFRWEVQVEHSNNQSSLSVPTATHTYWIANLVSSAWPLR